MMDSILRSHKNFARCYIDDIIIFSKILKDYLGHLNIIFSLFNEIGICLKDTKTYLGYSSIILLGQRVDGFRLTTLEKRIAAIRELKFPETLKDLETYLDFIN